MELSIHHKTRYSYSKPVTLLPHYLRFKPQKRNYFTQKEFDLQIQPAQVNLSERLDPENNHVFQLWMSSSPLSVFEIEAKIKVVTEAFNPFNFLIDPQVSLVKSRFSYDQSIGSLLKPYLTIDNMNPSYSEFINHIIKDTGGDILLFLSELLSYIGNHFKHQHKSKDVTLDADLIFRKKTGSCKELTWMFMQMLRTVGLAARFVSGYAYNFIHGEGHELHAWAEVFLPGAGWVGMDPTSGLYTDYNYIPVATSFDPELTMPVIGSFTGNVTSTLETEVVIE